MEELMTKYEICDELEEKIKKLKETTEYAFNAGNIIQKGLEILNKYHPEDCYFRHDVMSSHSLMNTLKITEEDIIQLLKMGWFLDESCWSHF